MVLHESFFEGLTYPQSAWRQDDFGVAPTKQAKNLLKANAPTTYVGEDECGPMDFYKQYLPLLRMGPDAELTVDRRSLKKNERNFKIEYSLISDPNCLSKPTPPLYAYSWPETMLITSGQTQDVVVLKYAFSFFKSGLPKDLGFFQGLGILGSNEKWHYLDIHGAIFYLVRRGETKPFALVLAQHNHFRSYLIGVDISLEQAKNICYAKRSNEPYLCDDSPKRQRTAPTFEHIRWIIAGENEPFLAGHDLIPGAKDRKRIDYRLQYLPSRDPLITSWNSLGPEIKIWGFYSSFYRAAPPGMAIFNTPKLRQIWKTAQYFYFDPKDDTTFTLHEANMNEFINPDVEPVLTINRKRYVKNYK
jgi:hypothetical protein